MANFIIGAILVIAALLLLLSTMAKINKRIIKKEIDENYETIEKPSKSKMDIQSNVRICMHDDEFTSMHLDDNENILSFISFDTKNVEMVDFYYSLMMNKKLVKIIYNDKEYSTVITEIKLISDRTLRIYYKVIY